MSNTDKWGKIPAASTWRELAVRFWPSGGYGDPDERVAFVLFDLARLIVDAHRTTDEEQLAKMYGFARWCYERGKTDSEIGDLPVTAFYEHLVDSEVTLLEIPRRIPPQVFEGLQGVFRYRLDEMSARHGIKMPGTFHGLLGNYDRENGTDFLSGRS